jgi:hypothetical protein
MSKEKEKKFNPKDPTTWKGHYVNSNGYLVDVSKLDPKKPLPSGVYKVISYTKPHIIKLRNGGTSTLGGLTVELGRGGTLTINLNDIALQNSRNPNGPKKEDVNPILYPTPLPNTPPNPPKVDDKDVSTDVIILKPSDVDRGIGRFNPPPHRASRSATPLLWPENSEAYANKNKEFNKRGIIFMDSDTAQHDNGSAYTRKDLWGFQFMYNPTSISYTNSANTNIDFTNQLDVALLLTGSQTFTLNLLLNRVTDMGIVRSISNNYQKNKNVNIDTGQNYNRKLSVDEVRQLATRGTDFDLEFLYRVLNGDPLNSPQSDYKTSDFGYISGMPVWIRLNDQMRYKGMIASISVNHVMFTRDMVPTMTEVGISFIRIPTMGYSSDKNVKKRFTSGTGDSQVSRIPQYSDKPTNTSGG